MTFEEAQTLCLGDRLKYEGVSAVYVLARLGVCTPSQAATPLTRLEAAATPAHNQILWVTQEGRSGEKPVYGRLGAWSIVESSMADLDVGADAGF